LVKPSQAYIEQQPVVEVELSSLTIADSPRTLGEDPDHVAALAATEDELPPIVVHRQTMRVIDGRHRLRAAELRGEREISVRFFDGDDADAFVLAVESNVAHGLPLTLAERKRAAGRIIASHPHWSDRMIASTTGIVPGTVAEMRRQTPSEALPRKRIGQDGRVRPINGAEGRRRASLIIAENPDFSLRQIARAAGISPETARDVRNRLRRGEDPLPKRGERAHVGAVKAVGGEATIGRILGPNRMEVVERLKSDPALRFSETGRMLLRLFTMHTISQQEWDKIIESVPPHCSGIVAHLAEECARTWSEVATRVEHNVAKIG
jgi:ParB-like chromosome segregation protein Spo0J